MVELLGVDLLVCWLLLALCRLLWAVSFQVTSKNTNTRSRRWRENAACFNNVQGLRDSSTDDRSPLPEKESNISLSNAGIPA
ncbi:hypothetical protein K1719_047084 [Acacia pycnantha]|nr:hypothetical protein K1719_047084 [Acacia pycnantha]